VSKSDAAAQLPGPDGDRFRIVTVGTVCERKAQHVLIEAAAKLARDRRDFVCYLVGAREELPYLSYVRNLIQARGIEDLVVLVPETNNVRSFLRAADVFVCCSYVEAFSLSVLEAEAFGLPIVSTPCGGLDEQVAWNRSALKFEFGRADALAAQLDLLISDDSLRTSMGLESQAAFDLGLTAEGMIDRYLRAIRSAVGVKLPDTEARLAARRALVA
jgi:glycosyltransferase involved in cell wall biosynthesis